MTVCNKPIKVDASEGVMIFDGIDFTGEALITLNGAKEVYFKNCRFYKLTPNTKKTMAITSKASIELKLVVEKCFFGENPSIDTNAIYHILEGNFKAVNGSSFSENYFVKGCNTHNAINFYDVVDGATIGINKNVFEYSGSAVRLGIKGAAKATFIMNGNTYLTTDTSNGGEWAGFLTIQPYGTVTTSWNDVTIKLSNTENKSGYKQLAVFFANSTDTHFDRTKNFPKLYIDGVLQGPDDVTYASGTVLEDAAATETTTDTTTETSTTVADTSTVETAAAAEVTE